MGASLPGIAGLNPAGDMDVSVLRVSCIAQVSSRMRLNITLYVDCLSCFSSSSSSSSFG
jgi:hypothetical protein